MQNLLLLNKITMMMMGQGSWRWGGWRVCRDGRSNEWRMMKDKNTHEIPMCHMQLTPFPELNSTPPALVGHRESLPEELPHFLLLFVTAQVQVVPPGLLAKELLPTRTHLLHLLQRTVEEGRTEPAPEISPGATSSHLAPFRNVQLMLQPAMYAWQTNRCIVAVIHTYLCTYVRTTHL